MRIHVLVLVAAVSLSGLTGCATTNQPTTEDTKNLDYGAPLTVDYQDVIKKRFERVVRNPASTQYTFHPPVQYWYQNPSMLGKAGKIIAGYAVHVEIDAQNSLGGDLGPQPYIFIFHDNVLVKILTPEDLRTMDSY